MVELDLRCFLWVRDKKEKRTCLNRRNNLIYKCLTIVTMLLPCRKLVETGKAIQLSKSKNDLSSIGLATSGLNWTFLLLHVKITLTFIVENLFKATFHHTAT